MILIIYKFRQLIWRIKNQWFCDHHLEFKSSGVLAGRFFSRYECSKCHWNKYFY